MVTCASGDDLCRDKDADINDSFVCNECKRGVHEACAELEDVDSDNYICLACIEKKNSAKRKQDNDEEYAPDYPLKRQKMTIDADKAPPPPPEDDFTPIPVETAANHHDHHALTNPDVENPTVPTETSHQRDDHEPIPMDTASPPTEEPIPLATTHEEPSPPPPAEETPAPAPPAVTAAAAAIAEETNPAAAAIPAAEDEPAADNTAPEQEQAESDRSRSPPAITQELTPGMDTGRGITIKQEQFPVPLLDIEHFMNLPESAKRHSRRYLDEPHPSLRSPVSPFREGKGSFSTGWWLAFHHYNRDLPEYKNIRKDIICCNLCGAQVKRGERARATSALVQHLKTKIHRAVFDQLTVIWDGKARDPLVPRSSKPAGAAPRRSLPKESTTSPMGRSRKNEDRARKHQIRAITRWIAETNQPMDIVETESFRHLVEVLQSTARVESKTTSKDVSDEISSLNAEVKRKNRQAMTGRTVWTTQGYSAVESSLGYQYLTAHFITNNFRLEALMLEAKEQVTDPKAHSMASEYLEDTAAWGMAPGLSYSVGQGEISNPGFVSSNELSSSTVGAQLEKTKGLLNVFFMDEKLSSTADVAMDFRFTEEDDAVPETRQVLAKGRELVAIFKQSSQRLVDLKKIQKDLPGAYKGQEPFGVIEDTEEFWWTTYDMIERLLKLRPALERLWQEDRELDSKKMLDNIEWDVLKQLLIVLKPLIMGVKDLENESLTAPLALVALNMIRGELTNIQTICERGEHDDHHDALMFAPTVSKCIKELLEHFDKTWGSLTEPFQGMKVRAGARNRQKGLHWSILMAYVLDPRFKELPHILNEKNKEAIWDAVLKEMAQVKKQCNKSGEMEEADKVYQPSEGGNDGEAPKENALMMYMKGAPRSDLNNSADDIDQDIRQMCMKELSAYKVEPSPPLYDADTGTPANPLDWWGEKNELFPTLWSMARVFLAIPVSAASLGKKFGKIGLKSKSDEPGMEMVKERMNIRCNVLDVEPPEVTHDTNAISTEAMIRAV